MSIKKAVILAALAAVLVAAPAAAHVTVQPATQPAASFTRIDVRVPNERDDEGTVKVDVEFPDGIAFASYEPVAGWDVKVTTEKATTPIDVHGEEITEQVKQITWTGDGKDGIIPPGAFQDFGVSLRTPDAEGETLTFPALQTYEGGDVVRWIGSADSEEPAPTVTLTAAEEEHGAEPTAEDEPEDTEHAEAPDVTVNDDDDDDGGSDGLAIAALVVGGLGLLTGGVALSRSRKD